MPGYYGRAVRKLVALAAAVTLSLSVAGCGHESDDDPQGADDSTAPATLPPTDPPSLDPSTDPEPADLGDAPVTALAAEDICERVPAASVTAALGTEVVSAEPERSLNPQCIYTYGGDSSSLATVSVATQRPEDVGGRTLQDAFDYVVDLNQDVGQPSELDVVDVAAGDRAVRLSGPTLTLVVMAVEDHLVAILGAPDVDPAALDSLAVVVGEALR